MASAVPPCLTLARPTRAPYIAGETAPYARGSESGRGEASCAGFQPRSALSWRTGNAFFLPHCQYPLL